MPGKQIAMYSEDYNNLSAAELDGDEEEQI